MFIFFKKTIGRSFLTEEVIFIIYILDSRIRIISNKKSNTDLKQSFPASVLVEGEKEWQKLIL